MRISDWSSDVCSSDLGHAGKPARGAADALIARAAADVTGQRIHHLVWFHVLRIAGQRRQCHDHARRAETALQTVFVTQRLLHRMQRAVIGGQSLDRRHCARSEEHTSELQSLMRISYAVFCLKKKK